LNDLVNREIVCAAARSSGFSKSAFNKYVAIKKSSKFNELLTATALQPDELREEIIKDELVRLQVEKIQEKAPVSQAAVQKFYNENKAKFQHGDRIRVSQILVAAPLKDVPPVESIRTQLARQNPKLSADELDAEAKLVESQKKKIADDLLAKAMKGED